MNYDQWLKSQAQPTVVVQQPASGINFLPLVINVVLVAVVAWLILGRTNSPGPQPPDPPSPTVDVVEITEKATRQYAENLAKVVSMTADKVASGELNSAKDVFEFSERYSKPARNNAFKPIDEIDNDHIPSTQWDDSTRRSVEAYLRDVAKGHQRAAE